MSDYVISCCSTADLTKEYLDSRNVKYLYFHYQLDGVEYLDDMGQTMPLDEFYAKMSAGAETKTSQINAEEYHDFFEEILKQGKDVFHLTLSSGVSGTINSANIAADMLSDEYPDRKIVIVDSLAASGGYGMLVDACADKRDEGLSIDELKEYAESNRLKLNHWFFSTDLTFFIKGGRVSKTSGFFGQMLNICPLLNVDYQGKLVPRFKIRTKKKVINAIVDKMEELANDGLNYSGKCFITNAACYEDARAVADLVESRFAHLDGKVHITTIGTTIGSHTGPGTVALFFWGNERVD